jgi:cytochrome P450 monooxygenase
VGGELFPSLDGALPVVGHLPEMHRRFPALCARGEARHGPLFWIHGGPGARQLMCTDASALEALKSPALSTSFYAEGFGPLLERTLFAFDGDEHRRIRSALAPAFTPARIHGTGTLALIERLATRAIARWIAQKKLAVVPATKELTLEIIFALIGVPGEDVSVWRRQFGRYLLGGVPSRGENGGPLHWIALRARGWLDQRLGVIVDRLRHSGDATTLIGAIANRRDEGGALLDRDLVVANLRLLVLAGHETTAAALAWNLLHIASSPGDQARAREEAEGHHDVIDVVNDGSRFTFAEAQFRESLRLYPAVHSVIRRVRRDLTIDVGSIPRGTLLNVPLVHLLRDARRFDAPARYRPERWRERPRPGTLETAMFGGGPHFCLGYHLAIAEGTLFNLLFARALGRAGLRLGLLRRGPLPPPVYLPLARPPRGLGIVFERGS